MDLRTCIGWNLRRLRAEQEISQEDFATDSGLDRGYISGVERAVRNISIQNLERIANALNVEATELVDKAKAKAFQKTYRRK